MLQGRGRGAAGEPAGLRLRAKWATIIRNRRLFVLLRRQQCFHPLVFTAGAASQTAPPPPSLSHLHSLKAGRARPLRPAADFSVHAVIHRGPDDICQSRSPGGRLAGDPGAPRDFIIQSQGRPRGLDQRGEGGYRQLSQRPMTLVEAAGPTQTNGGVSGVRENCMIL